MNTNIKIHRNTNPYNFITNYIANSNILLNSVTVQKSIICDHTYSHMQTQCASIQL